MKTGVEGRSWLNLLSSETVECTHEDLVYPELLKKELKGCFDMRTVSHVGTTKETRF